MWPFVFVFVLIFYIVSLDVDVKIFFKLSFVLQMTGYITNETEALQLFLFVVHTPQTWHSDCVFSVCSWFQFSVSDLQVWTLSLFACWQTMHLWQSVTISENLSLLLPHTLLVMKPKGLMLLFSVEDRAHGPESERGGGGGGECYREEKHQTLL